MKDEVFGVVTDLTATPPIQLIRRHRHADRRGWLVETYNRDDFVELGITTGFVRDIHSTSQACFTLRGLHFQASPHAEKKLIRCVRGRIFDVVVDIRKGSPTYGKWIGTELAEHDGHQLYVPEGFAHGYLSLEPGCEVTYKSSGDYRPEFEGGLAWDDPDLGIHWPMPEGFRPIISERDGMHPPFAHFESPFEYDGRPLALVVR
ncbi:dTDP-4-dehydrorhamnose 3,5-epimerase [Sphingomonas sp. HF-S3]|uniref:dTDP-4-dehydrorhamnose 3,5-epimerase n=1 Tax=Sphingomonas rustica TaxID=3103142 RepID=A0ABV0B4U6_9SPHN